jgi:hypothetical protein
VSDVNIYVGYAISFPDLDFLVLSFWKPTIAKYFRNQHYLHILDNQSYMTLSLNFYDTKCSCSCSSIAILGFVETDQSVSNCSQKTKNGSSISLKVCFNINLPAENDDMGILCGKPSFTIH